MPAKKILMIVGDFTEDYEVMVPYQMLLMVGHTVDVGCPGKTSGEKIKTAIHDFEGDQSYTEKLGHGFLLNCTLDQVDASSYDALVIPGGRAPEYLRNEVSVIKSVKHFVDENKPIASICHGPQILAAFPSYLKGKQVTAYPALRIDMENCGAVWKGDCGVAGAVVDGNLVTGQAWPGHPEWIAKFLNLLGTKIQL